VDNASKTLCLGLVLFAFAGTALAQTAWADDWQDASNYPAKAISITFEVLDSTHSVRFGNWTVSYRPDLPIMYDNGAPPGTYINTARLPGRPNPLVCTNPIVGQEPCFLMLLPGPPQGHGPHCSLVASNAPLDTTNFDSIIGSQEIAIPCPTSITFQH
jgi:hypothetical protein